MAAYWRVQRDRRKSLRAFENELSTRSSTPHPRPGRQTKMVFSSSVSRSS